MKLYLFLIVLLCSCSAEKSNSTLKVEEKDSSEVSFDSTDSTDSIESIEQGIADTASEKAELEPASLMGFWKVDSNIRMTESGDEVREPKQRVTGIPDEHEMYFVLQDSSYYAFEFEDSLLTDEKDYYVAKTISSMYAVTEDSIIITETIRKSTGLPDTTVLAYAYELDNENLILVRDMYKVFLTLNSNINEEIVIHLDDYIEEVSQKYLSK